MPGAITLLLVFTACTGDTAGDTAPVTATPTTTSTSSTTSTAAPIVTTTAAPVTTTAAPTTTTTTTTTLPPDPLQGLALELVAEGLHQPTVVVSPPGDDRLFVVERRGRIRIVDAEGLVEQPFLDLEDKVSWTKGIEIGVLGLVFHPEYADNGRFFVYYVGVANDERRLVEFTVGDDASAADPGSEKLLLTRPQPTSTIRHYAGALEFGPDGMLYVSLGDGAAPELNGQDPDTVFGAILRLDVDHGDTYAIPADNPFVGGGGAPEVWAFGLRNPWRFSIDEASGTMFIGDVGQERWEEIDVVSLEGGGANFGWPDTEGARCFLLSGCDLDDYTLPVLEYSHDDGCSITGGRVYRGKAIPELTGHYFYADWCGLWIRSFVLLDGAATEQEDWSGDLREAGQVQAFGADAEGELYIVNFAGELWKIVPQR